MVVHQERRCLRSVRCHWTVIDLSVVGRDLMSLLGSIVAVGLVIFHAMIAHGKISVALRQRELGDEGGGGTWGTYLQVLQSATVASRDATVSRSRKRGIFAFSSGGPCTVVARRQDSVTLTEMRVGEL